MDTNDAFAERGLTSTLIDGEAALDITLERHERLTYHEWICQKDVGVRNLPKVDMIPSLN